MAQTSSLIKGEFQQSLVDLLSNYPLQELIDNQEWRTRQLWKIILSREIFTSGEFLVLSEAAHFDFTGPLPTDGALVVRFLDINQNSEKPVFLLKAEYERTSTSRPSSLAELEDHTKKQAIRYINFENQTLRKHGDYIPWLHAATVVGPWIRFWELSHLGEWRDVVADLDMEDDAGLSTAGDIERYFNLTNPDDAVMINQELRKLLSEEVRKVQTLPVLERYEV